MFLRRVLIVNDSAEVRIGLVHSGSIVFFGALQLQLSWLRAGPGIHRCEEGIPVACVGHIKL